jgi:hypothetical protein
MRLLYLTFLFIFFFSCHERTEFNIRRIIANESSVPVRVEAYSEGEVVENLSILSGEKNIKDEYCIDERGNVFCDRLSELDIRWDRIADSIVLVFNQERIETFCGFLSECTFEERNLLLFPPLFFENNEHSTGYVKSIEAGVQVFTFTITEEDYQNADVIDG